MINREDIEKALAQVELEIKGTKENLDECHIDEGWNANRLLNQLKILQTIKQALQSALDGGWKPIASLPCIDREDFLVAYKWDGRKHVCQAYWDSDDNVIKESGACCEFLHGCEFTEWQPLPQPPQEGA